VKSVLGIAGSLRQGSYNRLLLRAAQELAPPGTSIVVYQELGSIPLYDADLERTTGGGPAAVQQLRTLVAAADGILLATPEYNHGIPGVLKNAIDWLSRPAPEEVLAAKPVAIIGASSGPSGTRLAQAALREVLYATESFVLPGPAILASGAARLFDDSGKLVDAAMRERLQALLAAFGRFADLVNPRDAAQ
jgi:chromate reductase, NAD(P)H dehydrogenase (quinone)